MDGQTGSEIDCRRIPSPKLNPATSSRKFPGGGGSERTKGDESERREENLGFHKIGQTDGHEAEIETQEGRRFGAFVMG